MRRRRDFHLLLDIVAAPGTALEGVCARAPVGLPLLVLGGSTSALLLWQAAILVSTVRDDPLSAELPGGAGGALVRFWIVRGLAALVAPLTTALRAAALASILHAGGLLLGAPSAWRVLLSLALHLEVVGWLENLCLTLVLRLHPPTTLEELQGLRLRAGLDLVWQPESEIALRLLSAANFFTVWWVVLLAWGLSKHWGWRRRQALVLSLPFWMGAVGLRFLLEPR